MPRLTVQVLPDLEPTLALEELADAFSDAADVADAEMSISSGDEDGRFVSYDFLASDLSRLWEILQAKVMGEPDQGAMVARSSIVVCEGKRGWKDYLFLHHYDRRETVEQLPPGWPYCS